MYCRLTFESPVQSKTAARFSSVFSRSTLWAYALLLVLANVFQSAFLVIPCVMLLSASYVADRKGLPGLRRVFPAWILLAIAIPLPFSLDQKLIQTMQFTASQLASWILDSVGQIHFRQGVILVTETKQFFAEEACSGIRSLFSSLAAIAIFGVQKRHPLWRHLFNQIQTFVWVVAGNAIRIAVVVFVSDNWTEAIGTGGMHELLGLGVFALIFLVAVSLDRAIQLFLPTPAMHEDYEFSNVIDAKTVSPAAAQLRSLPDTSNYRWIVIFGLILVCSARISYVVSNDVVSNEEATQFESDGRTLRETERGDLPVEINGWKVVDFERVMRGKGRLLAPNSCIWTLSKGNRKLIISLDGLYPEFHDLTGCYQGLGWSVDTAHNYERTSGSIDLDSMTTLWLKKANRFGIVNFSAFGRNGGLVPPPPWFSERLASTKRRLLMATGLFDVSNEVDPIDLGPIHQIQLFEEKLSKISPDDVAELKALFLRIREELLKTGGFSAST
jgi:exosortase